MVRRKLIRSETVPEETHGSRFWSASPQPDDPDPGDLESYDHSVIREPLNLGVKNVRHILHCMSDGTREVKNLLLNECNIIFECRVCSNLFRSLANFVAHKRVYCSEHYCTRMVLYDRTLFDPDEASWNQPPPNPALPVESNQESTSKLNSNSNANQTEPSTTSSPTPPPPPKPVKKKVTNFEAKRTRSKEREENPNEASSNTTTTIDSKPLKSSTSSLLLNAKNSNLSSPCSKLTTTMKTYSNVAKLLAETNGLSNPANCETESSKSSTIASLLKRSNEGDGTNSKKFASKRPRRSLESLVSTLKSQQKEMEEVKEEVEEELPKIRQTQWVCPDCGTSCTYFSTVIRHLMRQHRKSKIEAKEMIRTFQKSRGHIELTVVNGDPNSIFELEEDGEEEEGEEVEDVVEEEGEIKGEDLLREEVLLQERRYSTRHSTRKKCFANCASKSCFYSKHWVDPSAKTNASGSSKPVKLNSNVNNNNSNNKNQKANSSSSKPTITSSHSKANSNVSLSKSNSNPNPTSTHSISKPSNTITTTASSYSILKQNLLKITKESSMMRPPNPPASVKLKPSSNSNSKAENSSDDNMKSSSDFAAVDSISNQAEASNQLPSSATSLPQKKKKDKKVKKKKAKKSSKQKKKKSTTLLPTPTPSSLANIKKVKDEPADSPQPMVEVVTSNGHPDLDYHQGSKGLELSNGHHHQHSNGRCDSNDLVDSTENDEMMMVDEGENENVVSNSNEVSSEDVLPNPPLISKISISKLKESSKLKLHLRTGPEGYKIVDD